MNASSRHTVSNVHDLRSAIAAGWQPTFLYFWGHQSRTDAPGKHVLSQWWPAPFTIDGQTYSTAEQYMMAEKARLSSDMHMRARILATSDPRGAKALGREVRGFDAELLGDIDLRSSSVAMLPSSIRTPPSERGLPILVTGCSSRQARSILSGVSGLPPRTLAPKTRPSGEAPICWASLSCRCERHSIVHIHARAQLDDTVWLQERGA